ncbi:hypothetical protein [Aeromonas media]|uniref:hypothetical protein n=1 Tax=Aeromonas media TaxID=651 RepID=UPI003D093786
MTEKPKARPEKDILAEILEHTRSLQTRLNILENPTIKTSNSKNKIEIKDVNILITEMTKNGMSPDEIAIELNVPLDLVKKSLHRMRLFGYLPATPDSSGS